MGVVGERYSRAVHSSNLRERETMGDVDTLKAAALADRALGSGLLRLHDAQDLSGLRTVLEELIERVQLKTRLERIPARLVAERALAHFLAPTCPGCDGRKFELVGDDADPSVGRQTLSDVRCGACHGTGQRPMAAPPHLIERVKDCRQDLVNLAARARMRMASLLK